MMTRILSRFVANVRGCYSWKNILWQMLAILLTFVIVTTGFDWYYYVHAQIPKLQNLLFPAVILGGILPILLPAGLLLAKKTNTASAVTQAALIGILVSSFYKIFTGRIPPPFHSQALIDNSHEFLFGFMRDGMFWGWPSSHTTVAFAVV